MKRILKTLCIAAVCCICLVFFGCNLLKPVGLNKDYPHKWVEKVVTPTCTQGGYVLRYCIGDDCGTFSYNDMQAPLGHQLNEHTYCSVCHQSLKSSEGLIYETREKNDKEYVAVVGYVGTEREISIGYTPDGVPVTEIAKEAFKGSGITSVTVCEVVERICESAFFGCTELTNVCLSDSVKEIQQAAFDNCIALEEIYIPKNVSEMSITFNGCIRLKNICVDEANLDLKSIDGNLYYYEGRPYIKDKHFIMGKYAPGKTETTFTIPDGVTELGWDVFKDCSQLKNIHIPSTVEWIGDGAFLGCAGLTQITIPNGVKTIQSGAFRACSGLTEVEIPASVVEIQDKIFPLCENLQSIRVAEDNPIYQSIDGNLYSKVDTHYYKANTLIEYAIGKSAAAFTVPQGTKAIGGYAFEYAYNLKSVVLPESVEEIDWFAFFCCMSLERVTIPKSVKNLRIGTFFCPILKEIVYNGTLADWNATVRDSQWLFGANEVLLEERIVTVVCSDGEIEYSSKQST